MGTMTPSELLRLYTLEKITDQQAIGYALQNLVTLYAALETIDKMRLDIERLMAFVGMEPEGKKKEKRRDENETEGDRDAED